MTRKFKIMKRSKGSSDETLNSDIKLETKSSVQEREAIYEATRARIFSEVAENIPKDLKDHARSNFGFMTPIVYHQNSLLVQDSLQNANNVNYPYIYQTIPPNFVIDQSQNMYSWNHNFPSPDVNQYYPFDQSRNVQGIHSFNLNLEPWP